MAQGEKELNHDELLEKHSELFRDKLGTINTFQASLQVRPDARLKFSGIGLNRGQRSH